MHFFARGTTDLVANIQLPESTSNDRVVTEWSPMTGACMKSYKWVLFSWKEDNNVLFLPSSIYSSETIGDQCVINRILSQMLGPWSNGAFLYNCIGGHKTEFLP